MEKVVDTISRYPVIDPKYEFSAPQYVDFSHEESHGDIDRADQWFSSAIPNEASRKLSHAVPGCSVERL